MPLVSITRFRARALWFVPMFMLHAQRSVSQIRNAEGCIIEAILDGRQCPAPIFRSSFELVALS